MPDFVPIIDQLGEPVTILLTGFILALAFGFLAERSGFCTRSAVLDLIDRKSGTALAVWLVALGSTIVLVQYAQLSGLVAPADSRFFATPQSLSGPLIGGALFGIGMTLARGCSSRLLVLGASGNLRAIVAVAITAIISLAAMNGFLVPARDVLAGLANTSQIGGNELLASSGNYSGLLIGLVLLAVALVIQGRRKVSMYKMAGGLGIGAVIALVWISTYALSGQLFDPIAVEGLSFIRPMANGAAIIGQAEGAELFSLDAGILGGVVIGAFVASVLFRSFKVRKFTDEGAPHFLRYIAGGALMGFGGILAGGCTVGAGFSGGSVFAISAILALASVMISSAVSEIALRGVSTRRGRVAMVPAE